MAMMAEPMIEARGEDGKIELISEQDYYMRIYWHPTESDEYRCVSCRGLGYVRWERPVSAYEFGKYTPCPRCVTQQATPEPVAATGPAPWAK